MLPAGKDKILEFPVVITSYEIIIADSKFLQKYPWTYIAVDEGHRLKNFNCRLLRELRCFSASNKLLLSGEAALGHAGHELYRVAAIFDRPECGLPRNIMSSGELTWRVNC